MCPVVDHVMSLEKCFKKEFLRNWDEIPDLKIRKWRCQSMITLNLPVNRLGKFNVMMVQKAVFNLGYIS